MDNLEKDKKLELRSLKEEMSKIIMKRYGKQFSENEKSSNSCLKRLENIINYNKQKYDELNEERYRLISLNEEISVDSVNSKIFHSNLIKKNIDEKLKYIGKSLKISTVGYKKENFSRVNNKKDEEINKTKFIESVFNKNLADSQLQKYEVINENLKNSGRIKQIIEEQKKIMENNKLFESVKDNYQAIVNETEKTLKDKETEYIMKKLSIETANFNSNLLNNIDKEGISNDSLMMNLKNSLQNLKKLDVKVNQINNVSVNKENETALKLHLMFKSNSSLAKQNNIITQQILNFSNAVYEKSFKFKGSQKEMSINDESSVKTKEKIKEFKQNYYFKDSATKVYEQRNKKMEDDNISENYI